MDWAGMAGTIVNTVLGWLGYSKTADPVAAATATGEQLGTAKTGEANAVAALKEVEGTVAAGEREQAALAADPGKLHDPANPAAAAYRPGSAD